MSVTAKDILAAVRTKHLKDAVIREVVMTDPIEMAIRRRVHTEGPHAEFYRKHYAKRGEMVADEIPEGWSLRGSIPTRRIDALILSGTQTTAVEIKVSRADFLRETPEKRRAWMAVSNRFVYAAPVGLIRREEVPAGCGLWEFDPERIYDWRWGKAGLHATVKAKINKDPEPLPRQVLVALAYRVGKYEAAA
ncbi:hypothetical protein [Microbacterium sp. zg-YB36]|uniref:hypothetical protein n=1 Tax=Microbacterium sp. zg-YB36 TaxID=2969407 RepID=UPI00214B8B7E|nr:hypothetical protein [Microbacterium sp. zg-YB36]MDL5351118.1 hypothetical protein [Microbacterium sp. zg-YB36]